MKMKTFGQDITKKEAQENYIIKMLQLITFIDKFIYNNISNNNNLFIN